MGEAQGFKRCAFGGFDRKDVINYIENLASERNALASENEKLKAELEGRNVGQNESGVSAADRADEILAELEKQYNLLCADVDVNVAHVKCETNNVEERLQRLSGALKDTGARISSLRTSLHKESE